MIRDRRSILKVFARTRRYLWLALLIAVCALLVGGGYFSNPWQSKPKTWIEISKVPPAHTKVDESKPLRSQTREFELAGRIFDIPLMYIDGRPKPGLHQESMLLEVIWPDMRSPYELADRAEYERVWKVEHRRGWILLHPASARPSLDAQVTNLRQFLAKEEYVGEHDGLQKFLWYNGSPEGPLLHTELYLEVNERGEVVDFNRCRVFNKDKGWLYPGCEHKFVDGGLLYEISYNKAALFPQWREQRQRAIGFVNSLEINTRSSSKGDK